MCSSSRSSIQSRMILLHQFGVCVVPPAVRLLRSSFFFHILHFNILCVSVSLSLCVCGYRRLFLLLNLFRFSSLSTSASISLQRTLETGPLLLPGKCSGCRPQLLYIAQQMRPRKKKKKEKIYTAGLQAAFEKEKQVFSLMPHATMIESIVNIFGWAQLHTHLVQTYKYLTPLRHHSRWIRLSTPMPIVYM